MLVRRERLAHVGPFILNMGTLFDVFLITYSHNIFHHFSRHNFSITIRCRVISGLTEIKQGEVVATQREEEVEGRKRRHTPVVFILLC